MAYFESNNNKPLTESFQVPEILVMKFKTLITMNGGDTNQTLRDLNEIMSRLQGTDDDNERKAYFKAKKFHEQLVAHINKNTDTNMGDQIKQANKLKK